MQKTAFFTLAFFYSYFLCGSVPEMEGSVKNKFLTRNFVPAAQSLQVLGRDGYYSNEKVIGVY